MVSIDHHTAVQFLKRDRYKYFSELRSLRYYASRNLAEVLADASEPNVILIVGTNPIEGGRSEETYQLMLCGYDQRFLSECVHRMDARFEKFGLIITDKRLGGFIRDLERPFDLAPGRWVKSFVCTDPDRVPPITLRITKLTEADKHAVERYPAEQVKEHEFDLLRVFEDSVLGGQGEVLALKQADDILAFLDARPEYENIWDVNEFHVREELRNRGLGHQLAAAYARDKLVQGQIPYYGCARNEASERTAQKAGFSCCREASYVHALRK